MPFDLDCADKPKPAPDPLDAFEGFVREVRKRLDAGRAAYGDKSFARPPAELVAELQQEALDLAGWGFVLWCRLEAMRAALATPLRLVGAEREDFLAARTVDTDES
ncbi:MAG: hypothetical protein WDO69_24360 [Pseudomonadota bacterium]